MPPDAYVFPDEFLDTKYYNPPYGPVIVQAGPSQTSTGIPPLCAWVWFIPNPTPNYGESGNVTIYFNDQNQPSNPNKNVLFIQFDTSYISTLFGVSTARNSKIYFTDSTGAPLIVPSIGSGGAAYNINL
jgi:hypothetical protein